jgi:hypothetical protein
MYPVAANPPSASYTFRKTVIELFNEILLIGTAGASVISVQA